jgi:hypothetical protein
MDGYSPRTMGKILEYDWDIYYIYWETMKDSDIGDGSSFEIT